MLTERDLRRLARASVDARALGCVLVPLAPSEWEKAAAAAAESGEAVEAWCRVMLSLVIDQWELA